MLRATNRRDIAGLTRINSRGRAISAFFFSGLIQGLLLIAAGGAIKKLGADAGDKLR
jgi:hypothetical protein